MVEATSDFGKGLTYCLGLFLAHAERKADIPTISIDADVWFNGASDHLYELEIPDRLSEKLKERLREFQEKCLTWGHRFPEPAATEKDKEWAIQEAKDLLRLIDEEFGIKTAKGEWK